MAGPKIVYYFTLISPWAYLGHGLLLEMAARHGAELDYRPIGLGQIFSHTGGLPLAQRAPARQAYRMLELQRWREKRGVPLNLKPKFFPFDVSLADRAMTVLLTAGDAAAEAFAQATFAAVWAQDRNMADAAEIAAVLVASGAPAEAVLAQAASPETKARYQLNIDEALASGVFGSPCYLLNGELFFGQDRLELLGEALASGREAYLPA